MKIIFHVHITRVILYFSFLFREHKIKDRRDTDKYASYFHQQLEIDSEGWLRTELYVKDMNSIFPLCIFHLYVATFQQHIYMEYISLRWYDIPELVAPIRISLIEDAANKEATETRVLLVKLKSSLRKCYGCHRYGIFVQQWPR